MEKKLAELNSELDRALDKILEYWQKFSLDYEHGGFYGKIDHNNRIIKDSSKGGILNARILWTFSAAYNLLKREELLNIANRAYEYLIDYFIDKEYGGLYWELDHLGHHINTRKQIYAQGFGIYGFSEYYKASGNIKSLHQAQEIFRLIENHSFDKSNGGYIEALDRQWHNLEDMHLSDKEPNEPKTMNTHLHILEPYINLYHVWKDEILGKQLKNLVQIFLNKILDPKSLHFNLFFDYDWTVKSSKVSYGHDIEGSWLLTEAADSLGDKELLKEVKKISIKMVDITIKEGIDEDGSIFYEYDNNTGKLDRDKHWWSQAEALVGLVNAWQVAGSEKYLENTLKLWDFIKKYVINSEYGEWNGRIDKFNSIVVEDDIINFWKTPYHNARACMEVIKRINTTNK